jgi:hypothetical protein
MRRLTPLITALAVLTTPAPVHAQVHVDASATGPVHDGTSWCSAYRSLSEALASFTGGGLVHVAGGIYRPDTAALADPRDATFALRSGVVIRGSFGGCTAADPDLRSPEAHPTILSGDLAADDTTGGSSAENVFHVVTGSNADGTAELDGVIVTAGSANSPTEPSRRIGGGFYNAGGTPWVRNCVFRANYALGNGGGMANSINGDAIVIGCTFESNVSDGGGGGAYNAGSRPVFRNCLFIRNVADGNGGGVVNNTAGPRFAQCLFYDNRADAGGGAFSTLSPGSTFHNCRFVGNHATGSGGGAFHSSGTNSYVNCLFSGNQATSGGGLFHHGYPASVVNATITGNVATGNGGGVYVNLGVGGQLSVGNTIAWGNSDAGGIDAGAQIHVNAGTPTVSYSDVQGGWSGAGTNNIALDPLFADPDGFDGVIGTPDDDPSLGAGSPCIDAGDDTALPADVIDLDLDFDMTERLPWDLDANPRIEDDPAVPDTGLPDPPLFPAVVNLGVLERALPAVSVPEADRGAPSLRVRLVPNPARGALIIHLALPHAGRITLEVLDPLGRTVARPAPRMLPAGDHALAWESHDATGRPLAPGVYVLRVLALGPVAARTFVLRD